MGVPRARPANWLSTLNSLWLCQHWHYVTAAFVYLHVRLRSSHHCSSHCSFQSVECVFQNCLIVGTLCSANFYYITLHVHLTNRHVATDTTSQNDRYIDLQRSLALSLVLHISVHTYSGSGNCLSLYTQKTSPQSSQSWTPLGARTALCLKKSSHF